MATWATIADVELYTGLDDVSESDIIRAEADIAIFVGISPAEYDEEYASESDTYFLKLATSWQASMYTLDTADTFTHDITNQSQDGFSVTLTETGVILHAKAKWAIQKLSWNKPKTIGSRPQGYGDYFNNVCARSPFVWRRL